MHREYFEDTQVGDRLITPGRTITEADVVNFAGFTGDWNPIHVDEEFARRLPAGRRIAHGLLALVVGVNLISRAQWTSFWPRSVQTIAGIDRVRFVLPVFIGDTLHTEAEVLETRAMSPERGLITSSLRIKNQRDEAAITLRIQVLAGCRPKSTA